MIGLKPLSATCLIVASVGARASYEMMFVMAQNSEPGLFVNRVHRIDPVTGASFGSFPVLSSVASMTANRARGELVTIDINGILRTYDYSTGLLKSMFGTGITNATDLILGPGGNRVFVANGSATIRSIDYVNRAAPITIATGLANYTRLALGNTGALFASSQSVAVHDQFVPSGSSYAFGSRSSYSVPSGYVLGQMSVTPSTPGVTPNLWYGLGPSLGFQALNSNDTFSGGGVSVTLSGWFSSVNATAPAHAGVYAVGADWTTPTLTRVMMLDAAGFFANSFTFSGVSGGVRSVAIVLAPEPATFGALALGVIALSRRRRR